MSAKEILAELKKLGSDGYKRTIMTHGAKEPCFGVKIEDLKKIQKRVKRDYQLALDLYDSGNYDAMYLAGLLADDTAMSKKDLERWVKGAYCAGISEYVVPWVASASLHGIEVARKWIESKSPSVASSGWATFCSLVMTKDDRDLDVTELSALLNRVAETIHDQPNRVKYVMNSFVIAVGSGVAALTAQALKVAAAIGEVSVDMGGTACKVPDAREYVQKVAARGAIGKKRKSPKC